jgi:serine O-acetyltransferase
MFEMLKASSFHDVAYFLHGAGFRRAASLVSGISRLLFSAQIPPETKIGPGTEFGYGGIGVVVHRDAVIGANVLISPGVVIGGRSELPGVPVIEDGVKIGAGAKILGPIRVGAGAKVGANAVVIHDVPPGETVVGIPARPLRYRKRNGAPARSEESPSIFVPAVALG